MDLIRARRSLAPLENLRFWVADCGIGGIGVCQPHSSGKEQLESPPSAQRTQREGGVGEIE